ncbi:MAG: ECF transporter S component [Clostridia bacterium]|nr:ECF transporter S component [Clostridia bacterium]
MNRTQLIAFSSVFTALVAVVTIVLPIPLPKTEGFLNFGDAVIFVTGIFFGPFAGLIAGGIGSAAADLILGYTIWAPFTLLIKGAEGFVVGLTARLLIKVLPSKLKFIAYFISMLFASIIMIAGYFFATAILYGFPVAAIGIIESMIQAGASIAIAFVLLGVSKTVMYAIEKRRR